MEVENEKFLNLIEACSNDILKINAQDENGKTLLMLAAEKGLRNIVVRLLEIGADPDIRDNTNWLASNYARARNHKDILDILLEAQPTSRSSFKP